jgi:long-chain acyl-CoA synthetase
MAFSVERLLEYNDLTLVLGLATISLYLYKQILHPVPLAHPLLLGRQSDVSKVRDPGESACFRNYGVGHGGPLPTRPRRDVQWIFDLIRDDFTEERYLWSTKVGMSHFYQLASSVWFTLCMKPPDK